MAGILIRVSYDGTNYSGFQIQPNGPTIQEELEKALAVIYKQPVRIAGAGRTDAGVHARGQAVSYSEPFKIDRGRLPYALNALLPSDIVVTAAREVADSFHARFDALGKTYSYTIDRAEQPQVLKRLYSWHMPEKLNLQAISKAALLFAGTHDFKAFQAAGSDVKDTTRTIIRLDLETLPREQLLVFTFKGNGFLYRMVRMITGTLIRVGRGSLTHSAVEKALLKGDPSASGPTAPPHGLCLETVEYNEKSDLL